MLNFTRAFLHFQIDEHETMMAVLEPSETQLDFQMCIKNTFYTKFTDLLATLPSNIDFFNILRYIFYHLRLYKYRIFI